MPHLEFEDVDRGRWYHRIEQHKHDNPIEQVGSNIPSGLIVSLTTYTPRFNTTHLTLKSILEQTVRADKIIVWIADFEISNISEEMLELSEKVEFRSCKDIGPYKKLIYAISEFPDSYIVTIDDDAYYHRFWLQMLLSEIDRDRKEILCHIADRVHFINNTVASSNEWTKDVQDSYARVPSFDLVPVGLGGVLYPPKSLHESVTDEKLFNKIAPFCDDLWFYAMARLIKTPSRKVGSRLIQVMWPNTQAIALWKTNLRYRNDEALRNIIAHYGDHIFRN
ncbi:MAG: glycosyltransferase family A protein [Pseudomonadota bacterium]|jgi:hypothetical protein